MGYTLGGGNLNLQPETATTYSLGLDYQPNKQLHLNLNYFNINYKNQISSYLSDLTILQQEAKLGALITRCPSADCTSLINQYVVPGPVFGPILANPSVFVNGTELNLGTTKTQGLDFLANYSMPTDAGPSRRVWQGPIHSSTTSPIRPAVPVSMSSTTLDSHCACACAATPDGPSVRCRRSCS